jgi:hypothetical protein
MRHSLSPQLNAMLGEQDAYSGRAEARARDGQCVGLYLGCLEEWKTQVDDKMFT